MFLVWSKTEIMGCPELDKGNRGKENAWWIPRGYDDSFAHYPEPTPFMGVNL